MEEEQYLCKSYYDDNNILQDCTCGKCAGFIKGEQYLCAIGTTLTGNHTKDYEVGVFTGRNTFSFKNGAYSNIELGFRKGMSSNITIVIEAKLIDEIDFD